jgi:hypothetical protein
MTLLSYAQFLKESRNYNVTFTPNDLMLEGGAYGHLNHPFEDMDLTMQDFRNLINTTISGSFGPEHLMTEKTDGQNIMISWKNGKLIAARNKGHLKNAGENSLDAEGVSQMFAGRGDIEIAFSAAIRDLEKAIGALSEKDKNDLFANGKKFASVEVITPITQNVIPYGQNILVFHGTKEFDASGEAIDEDKSEGGKLGKLIKDANAAAQEMFFVRGPQDIKTLPFPNTEKRAGYYNQKLDAIITSANLKPTSTLGDYVGEMGKNILLEITAADKIEIPVQFLGNLVKRLFFEDKSYTVAQIKKDLGPMTSQWFFDIEKTKGKELRKQVINPVEILFLELGAEFMKNVTAFLTVNPTEAAIKMRDEIETAINTIKTTGGEENVKKLEMELKRIVSAGGIENIVPSEGVTFVYNGKLYKYTGLFAPINQIKGMLTYSK